MNLTLLKIMEEAGMAVTSSRTINGFGVVDFAPRDGYFVPEAESQRTAPCPHGRDGYCGFCLAAAAPKCKHGNPGYCGLCAIKELS